MLDELLDVFDPDRQRARSRRGRRGWIGRLGDDDDGHPSATGRRHRDWDDDLHLPEERLVPVPVHEERAAIDRPRRRRAEPDWEI